MKSLKEWRKVVGLSEEQDQEVDWGRLKQVFGDTRQLVKPQILQDLKTTALNDSAMQKYSEDYAGNKDELAKDLISAVLKIVFGSEAGSGLAVSGSDLQQQQGATPPPFGDNQGSAPGPNQQQPPPA